PPVAIVNEKFSEKFLGKGNPLGKQIHVLVGPNEPQRVYQIVGLMKNSKYQGLREEFQPIVFVAQSQDKEPAQALSIMVRSNAPLGSLMPALKNTLARRNGGISFEFHPFQTQVTESLLRERLMATLSGFFGFLAATLATVGLYGVISYMVARRRNEIGIRIALGADRARIINLVIKEAIVMLIVGLVIGAGLAAAMARTATSLLYGLRPTDPATMIGAAIVLALIAVAASTIPALRAARVEPMLALREE